MRSTRFSVTKHTRGLLAWQYSTSKISPKHVFSILEPNIQTFCLTRNANFYLILIVNAALLNMAGTPMNVSRPLERPRGYRGLINSSEISMDPRNLDPAYGPAKPTSDHRRNVYNVQTTANYPQVCKRCFCFFMISRRFSTIDDF